MTHAALGATVTSTTTHYNNIEEPLSNPDQQIKNAVSDISNSKDWNKIFDGMNIIKRAA